VGAPTRILLVVAGLLVAAPAWAQAEEEAPAEGEIDAPAEPPPKPRKLKKALSQLKSKEWPLATLSLHAVLKDDSAAYYHPQIRYYLAYALEQMGLNYAALEEYNRYLGGAAPDDDNLPKAVKRSVSLARTMDAGWLIGEGLSKIDTSNVTKGYQGPAMYWVGKFHYLDGNYASARAFLRLVPKNTEDYARARMLEGIALVASGKPVEAVAPLAAATKAAKDDPNAQDVWEVANLNLARSYYSLGNFERAIEHFEKTPRSSPLWFESLYEAAWGYFRLGRFSGALAHLQTVDSPFFEGTYHPDATLLRILIMYYLCKYIDGQEMLNDFTERHYAIEKELKEALGQAEANPDKLFTSLYAWKVDRRAAGIKLPTPVKQFFATDEDLVRIGDYLNGLAAERERLGMFKSGWQKSALRSELEAALDARKAESMSTKGKQALSRLRSMHTALQLHLGSSELYKVEMITAQKDIYDAAFSGRLRDKVAARKVDPTVPEGYHFWPFQGEYWVDELGWYEVNTINECLAIQK